MHIIHFVENIILTFSRKLRRGYMGEYSKGTIERRNRCFAVGLPLFVLAVIMLIAAVNVRASDTRTVTGTKNYLALRSSAKYSDKNVIGKLYNGEQVIITGGWDGDYVWVYAPSLDKSGFVQIEKAIFSDFFKSLYANWILYHSNSFSGF